MNCFIACWGFCRWEGCVVYMLWIDCEQFPREYSISSISAGLISCECLHMLCGIVPVPGFNEHNSFGSWDFEKCWWYMEGTGFLRPPLAKTERGMGPVQGQDIRKPMTLHPSFSGSCTGSPKYRFVHGLGNTLSSKGAATCCIFQALLSCQRWRSGSEFNQEQQWDTVELGRNAIMNAVHFCR